MKTDKQQMGIFLRRVLFPSNWPIVGGFMRYWLKSPIENFCMAYVLVIVCIGYFSIASISLNPYSPIVIIGSICIFALAVLLVIVGLFVMYGRNKEIANKRKERAAQEAVKRA